MIPGPYLLLAKVLAAIAVIVAIFAAGHHSGAKSVQADWDAATVKIQAAEKAIIIANEKHNQEVYDSNNRKNIEVSNEHTKEMAKIITERDSLRSGRVRFTIPVSSCATGRTETAGTSGHNDASTSTAVLPDQATNDLLDLAAEADQLSAQVRSCQNWIVKQGFYGKQ